MFISVRSSGKKSFYLLFSISLLFFIAAFILEEKALALTDDTVCFTQDNPSVKGVCVYSQNSSTPWTTIVDGNNSICGTRNPGLPIFGNGCDPGKSALCGTGQVGLNRNNTDGVCWDQNDKDAKSCDYLLQNVNEFTTYPKGSYDLDASKIDWGNSNGGGCNKLLGWVGIFADHPYRRCCYDTRPGKNIIPTPTVPSPTSVPGASSCDWSGNNIPSSCSTKGSCPNTRIIPNSCISTPATPDCCPTNGGPTVTPNPLTPTPALALTGNCICDTTCQALWSPDNMQVNTCLTGSSNFNAECTTPGKVTDCSIPCGNPVGPSPVTGPQTTTCIACKAALLTCATITPNPTGGTTNGGPGGTNPAPTTPPDCTPNAVTGAVICDGLNNPTSTSRINWATNKGGSCNFSTYTVFGSEKGGNGNLNNRHWQISGNTFSTDISGLYPIQNGITDTGVSDGGNNQANNGATPDPRAGVVGVSPDHNAVNNSMVAFGSLTNTCTGPGAEPKGILETAALSSFKGWACQEGQDTQNKFSQTNTVDFYADTFAPGNFLGSALAKIDRQDLAGTNNSDTCGGTTAHGFDIPVDNLLKANISKIAAIKDGKPHTILAFVIDLNKTRNANKQIGSIPFSYDQPVPQKITASCSGASTQMLFTWDKSKQFPGSYILTYGGRSGNVLDKEETVKVTRNSPECSHTGGNQCIVGVNGWTPGAKVTYAAVSLSTSPTNYAVFSLTDNTGITALTNCKDLALSAAPTGPTPTLGPGNIVLSASVHLFGVDNLQSTVPNQTGRIFNFDFFNVGANPAADTPAMSTTATLNYDPTTGYFTNKHITLNAIAQKNYDVYVKSPEGSLYALLASDVPFLEGKTINIPPADQNGTVAAIPPIPMGDINNDNIIDIRDYTILRACYGQPNDGSTVSADCNTSLSGGSNTFKDSTVGIFPDLNGDGIVDGIDYNILITNIGKKGLGK